VKAASLLVASFLLARCGSSSASSGAASSPTSPSTPTTTTTTTTPNTALPAIYGRFGNGVTVSLNGQTVVITTTDVPDHPSPYFGVGNAKYEAPQPGMVVNPNLIAAQSVTFRVPLTPTRATASATPLGPMGVATNGVLLFNQYAAGFSPLTPELVTFDRYAGHPTPSNAYHYHIEPLWLTANGKAAFIGVLLDGFPVYGPQDVGGVTPSDLDSCNGHVGVTADFPGGTYHYHVTSAPPYIAGCFAGAAGTVSGG
jgi:hypothetical protein